MTTPAVAADGMINIPSAFGVEETADRLESILIEKGMTIFNRISHSRGASNVGIDIRDTELIIFGNPKVGSLLMQCQQSVAIDLPQKALIWKDENSGVWISYNDPEYLKKRHQITGCDEVLSKIEKALAGMTKTAASEAMEVSLSAQGSDNNPATQALAGQMCPNGSHVIGFDSAGNIICTEACGNGVLNSGEACDDGNTETGDGCSATCQSEAVDKKSEKSAPIAQTIATNPGGSSSIPAPVISGVEPRSVVWGTSELEITVSGTGFYEGSIIIFDGSTYKPVVNQAGTQLNVTIGTSSLDIGPHAIKVSNGPGLENTRKRALAVY
jgi:cysteine-rich repeat protein